MNNLLRVIAILIMSVCSIAAYALPSVHDVEVELSKGNYEAAKTMLKEVIKEKPDSIVAHKYMLQVLDIEYAQTLKPSVEYKLYESSLEKIVTKLAADKQAALEKKLAKEQEEQQRRTLTALTWMLGIVSLAGVGYVGFIYLQKRQEYALAAAKEQEWINEVYADVLDINLLVTIMQSMIEKDFNAFDTETKFLLRAINKDNIDVQESLDRKDYHRESIVKYIKDAYDFFDLHGVHLDD